VKRLTAVALVLAAGCSSHATAAPAPHPSAHSSLSPEVLADPGLPSKLGPGPLTATQTKQLLQDLEDHVAQAYGAGDADALYRYLAGPMLTGNRATVSLLNTRHQRNVFRIQLGSVTIDKADSSRVVADVTADETLDYFADTATRKVLNSGLPGPSHLSVTVFLDYNPGNHTWYWTGQQAQSKTP
jgi:hypothetical protein